MSQAASFVSEMAYGGVGVLDEAAAVFGFSVEDIGVALVRHAAGLVSQGDGDAARVLLAKLVFCDELPFVVGSQVLQLAHDLGFSEVVLNVWVSQSVSSELLSLAAELFPESWRSVGVFHPNVSDAALLRFAEEGSASAVLLRSVVPASVADWVCAFGSPAELAMLAARTDLSVEQFAALARHATDFSAVGETLRGNAAFPDVLLVGLPA